MKARREGRRCLAWLLIAAMLVSTVCIDGLQTNAASSKKTVTKAGITYQVTGTGKKTAKVVKAKKTITKAEIPSAIKINGVSYKVTAVAKDAFKNCTKLKKVTIGKNVTSIGAKAFYGDKKLGQVVIKSKKLKSIGKQSFRNVKKSAIFYVYKAKSKAYKKLLKKSAVGWKKSMKIKLEDGGAKVTLSGVTYQVTSASSKTAKVTKAKTTITKAVIPATVKIKGVSYKVTSIAKNAFKKCTKLTSVTIGKNVTSIGANAFYGDKKLSKITINATGLKKIGKNAFYGIKKDAAFTLPKAKENAYKKLLTSKVGWKRTMTTNATETPKDTDTKKDTAADIAAYTYEITPLSDNICYYFYVKTDNPDPESFDFVDKETTFADDGEYGYLQYTTTGYADVVYTDTDTLRVNGGYIFEASDVDGGTLYLEKITDKEKGTKETTDITVTLPALKSEVDYLIDTYTNNAMTFFEKMDAIEAGLNSICLYSGAYVLGTLKKSTTNPYYGLSTSPHVDQSFYIQDPYYRTDNTYMLVTQLYPYILDSLGFPSMMWSAAKKLNSSATVAWSSSAHYLVDVTLDGVTKSYGGAGHGGGQGIEKDMITYWYTFDGTDSDTGKKTSWTDIKSMIKAYGAMKVEDVTDADELTWEKVAKTVGTNGSYVKLVLINSIFGSGGDGFTFLYQDEESDTYPSYFSNVWYDGRYFNTHEYFQKGTTFEDAPTADIVLKDVVIKFPEAPEGETYLYKYKSIDQAENYDAATGTWKGFTYFIYDEDSGTWITSLYDSAQHRVKKSDGAYTYVNIEDQDFIDACTLTKEEVEALQVDRNTNAEPTTYYNYNMKVTPGTLVTE